jgi:hypothetical protein
MNTNTAQAYAAGKALDEGVVHGPDTVAVPPLPGEFTPTAEMEDAWEQGVVDARVERWTNLRLAMDHFASVFDEGDLPYAVGPSMTCTEVEALAGLMRALGRDNAADAWIKGHAENDDCGDEHCVCDECKA